MMHSNNHALAHFKRLPRSARGLTLVELLVAMVLGLIVVMAAVAALTVSRTGARSVDAATQLRDEARFATDVVQRLVMQAGFEDTGYASGFYQGVASQYRSYNGGIDINTFTPAVMGYNNALPSTANPLAASVAHAATAPGIGSDTLILQYQPVRATRSSTNADGSMIDCSGNGPQSASTQRDDRITSVLYVDTSLGEPALMCIRRNYTTGGWAPPTPLLKGVESFQVLYGVDNVAPGAIPSGSVDSVTERYLRADQLEVAGNIPATRANWRRVRSLRIGMVLRGDTGSAIEANAQNVFPLGEGYASSADARSSYAPTDTRLRQVVTFTVNLRNCQNQGYQSSPDVPCDVPMPS